MQLAILLVVLCAVSGAESGAMASSDALGQTLETLAFLAIAPLVAVAVHADLLKRRKSGTLDRCSLSRRWEFWQTAVTWLWVGGCLAALNLANWPDVVRSLPFTLAWPLVDDLAILAPLVTSLLLVWTIFYFVERALHSESSAPHVPVSRYLALRVRHHLGLTLLPVLAILGVQECAVKGGWIAAADDRRIGWLSAALLAGAVIGLPLALKWLWRARCVADSPLKRRLLASCRRLGCPVRDIVVWQTGGTLANAAVAGLFPGMRTIFLSDALIARLNDEEIDVVVRHEAAHLARRHLWQRLVVLGLPALAFFALQVQRPEWTSQVPSMLASLGLSPLVQTTLLLPLAALGYAMLAVGWLARQHEHDADLAACCDAVPAESAPMLWTHAGGIDPLAVGHLHSALAKLVAGSGEYHRGGWLHPSVVARIEFLHRVQQEPPLAPRFRRRQSGLFWLLLAACVAALAAGLWPI